MADAELQLSNALPPATPPPSVESRDVEKDKVTLPMEETPCESPSACSTPTPPEPSVVETILTENQVTIMMCMSVYVQKPAHVTIMCVFVVYICVVCVCVSVPPCLCGCSRHGQKCLYSTY